MKRVCRRFVCDRLLYAFLFAVAVFLLSPMVLSGCTRSLQRLDTATEDAARTVRAVNEAQVDAALYMICEGGDVGVIRRRFNTPEDAALWRDLCDPDTAWTPHEPLLY